MKSEQAHLCPVCAQLVVDPGGDVGPQLRAGWERLTGRLPVREA